MDRNIIASVFFFLFSFVGPKPNVWLSWTKREKKRKLIESICVSADQHVIRSVLANVKRNKKKKNGSDLSMIKKKIDYSAALRHLLSSGRTRWKLVRLFFFISWKFENENVFDHLQTKSWGKNSWNVVGSFLHLKIFKSKSFLPKEKAKKFTRWEILFSLFDFRLVWQFFW